MPRTELPITNGFYVSRSAVVSNQICSNAYVHVNDNQAYAKEVLYGTAGLHQLVSTGSLSTDANRGGHEMDKIPYFVNGNMLYAVERSVDSSGTETFAKVPLGTVAGTGRVSMADNGTQLCVLNNEGTGYIYDSSLPSFTEITDSDFTANGTPQYVTYIDGYFLFTTNTKKFIISSLNDGLSYNALDFGSAEADPDDIVVPVVLKNQLYIAGSQTFEMFRNVGGSGFPFKRVEGGEIPYGVAAPHSMIKSTGMFAFVGGGENDDASIYTFNGSSPQVISTDAIDDILATYSEPELASIFGWAYGQAGDRFIGFTTPDRTLVYEIKSGRWHERKSLYQIDGVATQTRWRAASVVRAYNRVLVGDLSDGRIGDLDLEFGDEYDENIILDIATMPFSNMDNSIRVPRLELTIESGVGNEEDPNPAITMFRSLDGTDFKNGRTRLAGQAGQTRKRVIWRRNGRASKMETFRFTWSSKVKKVIIKLTANIV